MYATVHVYIQFALLSGGCSALLTEHERRFMAALTAVRYGRSGHARLELMMLCEGNDIEEVFKSFAVIADAMPEPAKAERVQ
ncbi:hypothetical protein GTF97_18685 [Roseobacter sp. HKCCD8767]|uniref:hypothetical protein n=2 Tax=unclassified Roseobacter TaxID=196798 RepID=UPI001491C68E|nr:MULTISPECIES: hypothetical protein [unclassified Roseobacter]NNV96023.1 hypothetical protein [Roseobacter sp. HKCCD8914]NNW13167.1 hypothetical protein [Roseobacter sp. HKCCD8484]NNW21815.1 hypothetical protein [Roseobacter sp. HKCCD7543]NNW43133.1 hypothetical protein [Roseobacter sp. HKCCD8654]NNW47377.1 hypothetical protein [Roseobacter sp. HKCCD8291]NNW81487.1 hypothetical protein [Roseobacter sp. HKCCD8134]NNW89999.1 hypothetical protein [Roseobacter sp. HKCCD8272]NNX36668.1 hypothe